VDQHPDNPAENTLGAGVSDEDLLQAIEASGYSLQSVAVDVILQALEEYADPREATAPYPALPTHAQEEWSYVDSDSGDVRHIDAFISTDVTPPPLRSYAAVPSQPTDFLRYHLDFLIECKQSDLPYIFFLRKCDAGDVPRLLGLPHESLRVHEGHCEGPTSIYSVHRALGLTTIPFAGEPLTAISMSRASRRGKKLELSGEESFRSITLPLIKALAYYGELAAPTGEGRLHYDVRLAIPLVVLRAPMVGVHLIDGQPHMKAHPWVRLVRIDPDPGKAWYGKFSQSAAIDVVHVGYLPTYMRHARETAVNVTNLMSRFAIPVLTGEAKARRGDTLLHSLKACISVDQFMEACAAKARRNG
jgi:hypothetical protein